MMEQKGKRRILYSWLVLGVFLLLPPISFGNLPWYTAPLGALVLFFTLLPLSSLAPGLKKHNHRLAALAALVFFQPILWPL